MTFTRVAAAIVLLAEPIGEQVPTPARLVTDPQSVVSPSRVDVGPVPLDDLAGGRRIIAATWSADGRQVFVSTDLTGRFNVWRTDASGAWPVQLTRSDEAQNRLVVSPEGRTLFYQQDYGGGEYYDLYAVPTAGGASAQLTLTPDVSESEPVLSHSGHSLAYSSRTRGRAQTDMAVMDVASGKVRPLTAEADPQRSWTAQAWVDGDRALIATREAANHAESEIWRVEVATGRATKLLGAPGVVYQAVDADRAGRLIALSSDVGNGLVHAGLLDASTGQVRWLPPTPWEQRALELSHDGGSLLVSENRNGRDELSLVDTRTLVARRLALPPGVNRGAPGRSFSPDGRQLLVGHSAGNAPPELLVIDIGTGVARPLIRTAMASLDPATLPPSEVVTFRSFDGTLVSAVMWMPSNLRRDGHNPAVVLAHGGPASQTLDSWQTDAVALATRGYVVIAPNPRGSTGYGRAFQAANTRDLGGADLKDEIAAKRFLVATGYVDAARVGITGGSYGGFMTLMAIGRAPEEFAAAVQRFGIIDWRTMWAHEDARLQAYQRTLLGAPDEAPAVYDAASPLTYIAAVRAPLLSLQGENDVRVPRGQAQQVTDAIRARGRTAEVVFYPGEGHGFLKRETNLDATARMVSWFDKFLKVKGD